MTTLKKITYVLNFNLPTDLVIQQKLLLFMYINNTIKYLNQNNNVALILLDLSTAFDTVDNDILLKRLQDRFSVYGKALTWFSSYLSDHVQRICISSSLSEKTELEYGAPKRSVLGPYLFTMYMDPLGDVIVALGVDHHIYADDTQLYCPMSLSDCESVKSNLSV